MRPLSRLESWVLLAGGLLMVVGSAACILLQTWGAYVFAVGSLMFVAMQLRQTYDGKLYTVRRLRRMMILSDVLFLVAALMLIANQSNFLGLDYYYYVQYIHNNWVIVLLVAAVLQLYSSHRIANELEKEQ